MKDTEKDLREMRSGLAEPGPDAVDTARRAFIEGMATGDTSGRVGRRHRPSARVLLPAAGIAGLILLLAVSLQLGTGAREATAADIEDIADLAERQRGQVESLGHGQYLLSRFATVAETTTTYDDQTIQRLRDDLAAPQADDQPERAYFDGITADEVESGRRAGARRRHEIEKIGVDDLPAKTVSVSRRSESAVWIDGNYDGGSGELPEVSTTYASATQRATAMKLRLVGIGNAFAELSRLTVDSEIGRFDRFTWPSDEIRELPADPAALAQALRSKPLPYPLVRDGRSVVDDEELFHVAVGLLRSPFASPELRAATVRMVGAIAGVEVRDEVKDVRLRRGFGVTLATAVPRPEVVIDRNDSHVLGVNYAIDRPAELKDKELTELKHADKARIGTAFEPAVVIEGAPVCSERSATGRVVERYCPWKVRPVK